MLSGIHTMIGRIPATVNDGIFDFDFDIKGAILDPILNAVKTGIGWVMFYVVKFILSFVNVAYKIFGAFAGTSKVAYDGDTDFLINIIFRNRDVNMIYWGMAVIGIVLTFAFAIIAVIRKIFDINDKLQNKSIGTILTGVFKSILTILVTSMAMVAAINVTNILVTKVDEIFNNAKEFGKETNIVYTDEDYAAMARVLNTVGNYSLNASYNSRYNINSCYNDIRDDLYFLEQDGVFDAYYITEQSDVNGDPVTDDEGTVVKVETWQSLLQRLAAASDPRMDLALDVWNPEVASAITDTMKELKNNADLKALEKYERPYVTTQTVPLDVVIFLMGTTDAAKNEVYNKNPSLTDGLRGAFYNGEKDIYDLDDVQSCFNTDLGGISYLTIILLAYFVFKNMIAAVFGCIARIINLIGLYFVAPPLAAVMPFDDGDKFKQWVNACLVQMLGVFGNIIPLRIVLMIIPMITDSKFVIIPNSFVLNLVAKGIMIAGAMEATGRFSNMLNGILAGYGASESARAGDMGRMSASFTRGVGAMTGLAGISGAASKLAGKMTGGYGALGLAGNIASLPIKAGVSYSRASKRASDAEKKKAEEAEKKAEAAAKKSGSGGSSSSSSQSDSLPRSSRDMASRDRGISNSDDDY